PDDPDPQGTSNRYIALLRRHARSVLGVMERQVELNKAAVAAGTLHPDSLLALVASGMQLRALPRPVREFVPIGQQWGHSDDYRTIVFRGESYSLTTNQALVVQMI